MLKVLSFLFALLLLPIAAACSTSADCGEGLSCERLSETCVEPSQIISVFFRTLFSPPDITAGYGAPAGTGGTNWFGVIGSILLFLGALLYYKKHGRLPFVRY